MSNAVDFSNPEALAAELDALEAAQATEVVSKPKKEKKPKMVTCPHCNEVFELPKSASSRGAVAGMALSEMTDDQLRIEYRNANSVFYKQTKAKGQASDVAATRLEAVKDEMDARGIAPSARAAQKVDAASVAKLIAAGTISVEDIQAMLDQLGK